MQRTLAFALALSLHTGAAFAHAALVSQSPANGTAVPVPAQVILTFTEAVTLDFTGIALKGADGKDLQTGAATLSADGLTLTVPIPADMTAGAYTVEWHALSEDGHKSLGTYIFTVK